MYDLITWAVAWPLVFYTEQLVNHLIRRSFSENAIALNATFHLVAWGIGIYFIGRQYI